MGDALTAMVSMALVNNVVLSQYLGVCPALNGSQRLQGATVLAASSAWVLLSATVLGWLLDAWVLAPLSLTSLRLVAFLCVIATLAHVAAVAVRALRPRLHFQLGILMPLLAANSAVLGVVIMNARENHAFLPSLFSGLGAAAGFALAVVALAAAQERLGAADVPRPFRGAAIALITAGLMSLAITGLVGMAGDLS